MRKTFFIIILFSISNLTFGQANPGQKNDDLPKRNSFYLELGGQGLLNSLWYDRLFRVDKKIKTSLSIGLLIQSRREAGNYFTAGIPFAGNILLGRKSHHLELGIGFTSVVNSRADFFSYLNPKFGYRFQRPKGGFFFRAGVIPMVYRFDNTGSHYYNLSSNYADWPVTPIIWYQLSFGFTLKK